MKNKYEIIIPERRYIVTGLEEVKKVLERYKVEGVCIKLMEN